LDDVRARASQWCDQTRLYGKSSATGELDIFTDRLDAIGDGIQLRRQLDGMGPGEPIESARRTLVRRLSELQVTAIQEMGDLITGTPRHGEVALRAKDWLVDVRVALRNLVTGAPANSLRQAMAIEGLRNELEWLSVVVARLDRETTHPLTAWLDVELGRLRGWLDTAGRDHDARDESLRAGCERLQAIVIDRRIQREMARTTQVSGPEALWVQRFQLSRLQAQVEALLPGGHEELAHSSADPNSGLRLEVLEQRRVETAGISDDRMAALPMIRRGGPSERIVQSALDEIGETIAFLEDMTLRRAVKRLELLREDLERLVVSLVHWSKGEPRDTSQTGVSHEAKSNSAPSAQNGLEDARENPDPGLAEDIEARRNDSNGHIDEDQAARTSLRRQGQKIERAVRQVHREWQEKLLTLRMESLFGHRFVMILENTVLALILVLFGLMASEAVLERLSPGGLSAGQHEFFAWADLAVCSVFLFEFGLKLSLAPHRLSYFIQHMLIDLIASLPFGFVAHQIELEQMSAVLGAGAARRSWWSPTHIARLARSLRFLRFLLPIVRLARVALILLRLSDRLVRRMARVLNRNIVLFEPFQAQKPESSDRHRLVSLRSELEHARSAIEARLDRDQRRQLAERVLGDLQTRADCLPSPSIEEPSTDTTGREIPVEAVVEKLIQMTPERVLDRMGAASVKAVDRYMSLLDLPLVRRLPVVRNLVAYREKNPAEAVALAANYLGYLIQRGLDVVYFFADLHGTLSPPVFLDRLGATIVNAVRTPAKRLLSLGSAFLVLFLIVEAVSFLRPFRTVVVKIQNLMGWPVIALGIFCLAFWLLGAWFRKIANQSADFCERVVEAQFATHTKALKSRRHDQDAQFLAERVIDPELLLRTSDDRDPNLGHSSHDNESGQASPGWFENRELAFLRNVRLLYQDYLDGSPLHRSDTKASVQLLGNLALGNLRRSHLDHLLRESRTIDRLDLSRAGGLFGGPYLWFNYITRMLVQETALLILDYNRHAIPVDRLACSPEAIRRRFRDWLADRLKIDPEEIWLPELMTPEREGLVHQVAGLDAEHLKDRSSANSSRIGRREAGGFLETVEFTAVDFLADDAERDCEIHARFGPQVAELVRRDRQQNVRRAFRSFPLHELPLAARTINPFSFYESYLAGGRIMLLPLWLARAALRGIVIGFQSIYRVVHEILHPHVDRQRVVPSDTYWAALRKIHRMRKPVFMGSLWLRARFDVEYLGLPLPSAPEGNASQSLMETDLDYIGATRRDRIIAEQVRRQHQKRLEWVGRWLDRFGWTFDRLPLYLAEEIPFLANRGGEALRALVAVCILDHDDIATLSLSIEGLKRVMEHASATTHDPKKLPRELPDPVVNLRRLWHPVHRCKRPIADLFELPCFPAHNQVERRRIVRYLRRHRRAVRGWIKVVLGQGGRDPWDVVKARMRDVLLRTDLWSDQILVLRAVQSLAMLDLQHNCELVWSLGGYTTTDLGGIEPGAASSRSPVPYKDEDLKVARVKH
jgi:hypothetical protein